MSRKVKLNAVKAKNIGTGEEIPLMAIMDTGYTDQKIAEVNDEIATVKEDLTELTPIKSTTLPIATSENYSHFAIITQNGSDRLFINLKKNAQFGWWEFRQGEPEPSGDDSAILGQAIIGTLILGKA